MKWQKYNAQIWPSLCLVFRNGECNKQKGVGQSVLAFSFTQKKKLLTRVSREKQMSNVYLLAHKFNDITMLYFSLKGQLLLLLFCFVFPYLVQCSIKLFSKRARNKFLPPLCWAQSPDNSWNSNGIGIVNVSYAGRDFKIAFINLQKRLSADLNLNRFNSGHKFRVIVVKACGSLIVLRMHYPSGGNVENKGPGIAKTI